MANCMLSIAPVRGIFLGSKERIVVAGNSPTSKVQIYFVQDDEIGGQTFTNKCEVSLSGVCTDLEICGVSRMAKTFLAVAITDCNGQGVSSIDILNLEAGLSEASMQFAQKLKPESRAFPSSFSSLSYFSDRELLAAAADSGDITIWDLSTGKEVHSFSADASGVTKVEFTRSGQLVTCGLSNTSQLQVWDIRSGGTLASNSAVLKANPLSSSSSSSSRFSTVPIRSFQHPSASQNSASELEYDSIPLHYSSVCATALYNKILCGTSRGSVGLWDLRTDAVMEFQAYSSGASVTAVTAHPWSQDIVLSGSSDGFVTSTNLQRVAAASVQRDPGLGLGQGQANSGSADNFSEILLREPGAITSLDCNRESSSLLATSAVGGLWRLPLQP